MATSNSQVNILLRVLGAGTSAAQVKSLQASFLTLKGTLAGLGVFAAAGAITATVAGLANLTKNAINTADAMGKLAQKTGIGIETLSGLSFAAKLADVSQQQLQVGIKTLSVEMAKAGRGAEDVYGELLKIAGQFADMPDGAEKTALAVKHFGKAGQELIPLLNQGSAAIERQMEMAKRLGLIIGPEFAADADKFNDNLDEMKARLEGAFLKFASDILPRVNVLMKEFFSYMDGTGPAPSGFSRIDAIKTKLEGAAETAAHVRVAAEEAIKGLNLLWYNDRVAFRQKFDSLMAQFEKEKEDAVPVVEITRRQDVPGERPGSGWHEFLDEQDMVQAKFFNKQVEFERKLTDLQARESEARKAVHRQEVQQRLQATSQMFGDISTAASAFGKKGFAIAKAAAIAQAMVNTYQAATGAYAALASIYAVGPVLGAAAAAAAVAAGLANVAQIASQQPPSYAAGGYTGNVPTSQPAGIVHGGEYVLDNAVVQRHGVGALDAFAAGDMPGMEGGISMALVDNRAGAEKWLRGRKGKKFIMDVVGQNKHEFQG